MDRAVPWVRAMAIHVVVFGLLGGLAEVTHADGRVVVLALDGTIQPGSLRYLHRGLDEARSQGADAILIELDTPGGVLLSLREMITAITQADRPVVVFVTPAGARAASAGFLLLLAADVAAMAPGTNTGAAHPVALGGKDDASGSDIELAKATEDAAALARSLAARRGRSVAWADQAVRRSLSYTEKEALQKELIDRVATSRDELLEALAGRSVRRFDGRTEILRWSKPDIVEIRPTASERLLMLIADPQVAYLLLMVGMVGLFVEIMNPGLIVPGVVGALSLLMALYAFSVIPIHAAAVLLIALAIGLFIAEAMVTSYGLFALAGLFSFVLGSLLFVQTPVVEWQIGLRLVLPTALVLAGVVVFLVRRATRVRRRHAVTGAEGLVGEIGEVVVSLDPAGKVFVHGEYWNAIAERPMSTGTKVRVVRLEGTQLEVRAAKEAPAAES